MPNPFSSTNENGKKFPETEIAFNIMVICMCVCALCDFLFVLFFSCAKFMGRKHTTLTNVYPTHSIYAPKNW